ncbi:MAG: ABC transporter permease [Caldilineae bacterium]|nr:MAG: ABC transporter permease [Caldilineae bacterium]
MTVTTAPPSQDERLVQRSFLTQLLNRPELGAVAGTVVVWIFFVIVAGNRGFLSLKGAATYLEVAAELGILAVAVALLMIGGEFDLSIGSIVGAVGMTITVLAVHFGWPLWLAIFASLILAMAVGYFNGWMVMRTGLPSFIITLGTLFIFRGATIGITRALTGRTQLGHLDDAVGYPLAKTIFAHDFVIGNAKFAISIFWWIGIVLLGAYILRQTQFGNWIFGVGGSQVAARQVGVPVRRVKIILFMMTAGAAWLLATIQAVNFTGSDTLRGTGSEFEAIIAAVIGGNLLTGGYGSVIGAAFGALIFGIVKQGIVFAGVDADWFQVFMGFMLLIAVLINNFIRQKAAETRR